MTFTVLLPPLELRPPPLELRPPPLASALSDTSGIDPIAIAATEKMTVNFFKLNIGSTLNLG